MNGNQRKLSADQVAEIARLRETGWSYKRLADRFNVSPGAIHYQCLREGALSPRAQPRRTAMAGMVITGPSGRVQRRFSAEEDATLLALRGAGMSMLAVARAMDRPITSVRIRVMTLALDEEREEQAAA